MIVSNNRYQVFMAKARFEISKSGKVLVNCKIRNRMISLRVVMYFPSLKQIYRVSFNLAFLDLQLFPMNIP